MLNPFLCRWRSGWTNTWTLTTSCWWRTRLWRCPTPSSRRFYNSSRARRTSIPPLHPLKAFSKDALQLHKAALLVCFVHFKSFLDVLLWQSEMSPPHTHTASSASFLSVTSFLQLSDSFRYGSSCRSDVKHASLKAARHRICSRRKETRRMLGNALYVVVLVNPPQSSGFLGCSSSSPLKPLWHFDFNSTAECLGLGGDEVIWGRSCCGRQQDLKPPRTKGRPLQCIQKCVCIYKYGLPGWTQHESLNGLLILSS